MTNSPKRTCYTCQVPTQAAMNSAVCDGWRSRDGGLTGKAADCPTWKVQADTWSIAEAKAFAAFVGLPMSRPTIIKICRAANICRRRPMGTPWVVDVVEFRRLIVQKKHDQEDL